MILVDGFCGTGGAALGWIAAGFTVVGVDIDDQPGYPGIFRRGDFFDLLPGLIREFSPVALTGGPPCQVFSPISHYSKRVRQRELVNLLPRTQYAFRTSGLPYVIENVPGARAHLRDPVTLCGQTFGLKMYRHRLFESNVALTAPAHLPHVERCAANSTLPTAGRPYMTVTGRNGHHSAAWRLRACAEMGLPATTTLNGVCEAIPPAYTAHLGRQLMSHLTTR